MIALLAFLLLTDGNNPTAYIREFGQSITCGSQDGCVTFTVPDFFEVLRRVDARACGKESI
jgi:hypothetical protein